MFAVLDTQNTDSKRMVTEFSKHWLDMLPRFSARFVSSVMLNLGYNLWTFKYADL